MKTLELNEHHLRSIELREIERADLGDNLTQEARDYFLTSHFGKALVHEGEIVMIIGGIIDGLGCRTWLLASRLLEKFPISCMKACLEAEKYIVKTWGIEYFYTYNLPDFERPILFLRRLGYEAMGPDSEFEDDKERILFVKKVG